jgi:hypothetical protein
VSDTNGIGLAEFINEIKRELLSLETEKQENVPLFSVDEVELELQVTVRKEGGGGLSIQVIQLGGQIGRHDVQRAKVTLTPLLTKEERLEYFKTHYPENWKALQEGQIQATMKGSCQGSLDDFYGN